MTEVPILFDRALLQARKERAARMADAARGSPGGGVPDFLLARVTEDLCERLAIVRREFPLGANIGAYHGLLSRGLRGLPNVGTLIDVEPAQTLNARCQAPAIVADEETLPFAEGSLDLAVSALSLQFVNDLPGTLTQIRRALKPDGLLLAALLGGETLTELRQCWLQAESEIAGGASPRVLPFVDVRQMGSLLQRAGFALPVVDSDTVRVTYATPLHLMRELRAMGAGNILAERSRKPTTRGLLLRASEIYVQRFGTPQGRIPATFEIITVTAWVPHESQPKPLKPGSATMRLADAVRQQRPLPKESE